MAAPEQARGIESYMLPVDEAEMRRLDTQHDLWALMIGDIYPKEVAPDIERALAGKQNSPRPTVLDVGCGSGMWAMTMATRYPAALVVGCDINEQPFRNVPDNFQFVRGDLSQGLPDRVKAIKYDVVHCRCVAQHVPDPESLVAALAAVLEPDGILLLADGDWVAFDTNKQLLIPFVYNANADQSLSSFYAGWLHLIGTLTRSRRYKFPAVLIQEHGAFQEMHARSYYAPVNWDGKGIARGREIGRLMDRNMRVFFENTQTLARGSGVSPATLERWKKEYFKELGRRRYNIWHYSWAQKIEA